MIYALLSFSVPGIFCSTCLPPASGSWWNGQAWVIVLRLRRWRRGRSGVNWPGNRCSCGLWSCILLLGALQICWDFLGGLLNGWGKVGSRMFALGTWRNVEEFIKGQNAWLTAFPAYKQLDTPIELFTAIRGQIDYFLPFCPSWKIGGPG